MAAYLARRLGHAVTVLFVVCTLTFLIIHLAPGGPALLADPKLTAADRRAIEAQLGLDQPLAVQYGRWVGRLARGDLGQSFLYQMPNGSAIRARLPNTVLLAGCALTLSLVLALPLGIRCAARPGGWLDRIVGGAAFLAMAIPTFWLAIGGIFLFAVYLRVLPAGGAGTVGVTGDLADRLRHLVLPVLVLAAVTTAELLRYARSAARTAYALPMLRVVQAKGVSPARLRWKHVTRNVLIPVVTVLAIQIPRLVSGAAITETVFSWPGMGRLGVQAALGRDYPLVMAITLFVSLAVVLVNIVVDLFYVWADPRIRLETS